ncbi:uncharacterized protein LOC129906972 [Episyrphus balteatus]|uniref:uncharacterized protein LOC129906972 n=1 Tax=Episyrphus balteatus TaxID=286459 RepID=UPI0024852530|nr:uncharacterized protein LOC129906972 [Episyrphus balteatus]
MHGGSISTNCGLINVVGVVEKNEPHLDRLLQRFWESEEIDKARVRTAEQQRCEDIFLQIHCRLPGGSFQVNIPLRDGTEHLGSSRAIALHRFRQLERRFMRDPALKEKYFVAIKGAFKSWSNEVGESITKSIVLLYSPSSSVKKVSNSK